MAYSADSFVADEQPTTAKWNKLWSNDASFNDGSGFAAGALGSVNSSLAAGIVCQVVQTDYSAVATGTTIIPQDDTIPQITEGTQFMSISITPKDAANTLIVEAQAYLSASATGSSLTGALFRDSTADAIAAAQNYQNVATGRNMLPIGAKVTAGSTSSTTFTFRGGPEPSGGGTMTFNGASSGRQYGAAVKSWIRVTEVAA